MREKGVTGAKMEVNQWLEKAKDYVPGTAATPDTELNAAEVANLWNTCMQYSMLSQVLTYFVKVQAHNHDIHAVLTEGLGMTEKRAAKAAGILRQANIPAPAGFTVEDINLNAPGLYTDAYHLYYLKDLSRFGLSANLDNLFNSSRLDVTDLYEESITSTIKFNRKVINVMLSRGILPRHPYMPVSGARDLTRHPSFFRGFLGKKRPLLGQEINHLFASVMFNHFGRVLLTGFSQVARAAQVRDYMLEGIKIADGIIQDFTATLQEDGITAPLPPGAGVTDSQAAPFSDKLMMYHVSILSASAGGIYAASLEASPRHDISAKYAQLLARAALYTEKGARIMMRNGWLEEPPQVYRGEQAARERLH